jgi:hypothetical protein
MNSGEMNSGELGTMKGANETGNGRLGRRKRFLHPQAVSVSKKTETVLR